MQINLLSFGIEGSPGVGKSTFWNLFTKGYYKEKRQRTSEIISAEVSPEVVSSLFKKIPEGFFQDKKIIFYDLPGHTIFSTIKQEIRSSFSAGILLVDRNNIKEEDMMIIKNYSQKEIPLLLLVLNYERKEKREIEEVINKLPEYPLPFDGSLCSFSYLDWSNKININWSKLLYFLYKIDHKASGEIENRFKEMIFNTGTEDILYVTSTLSRRAALESEIGKKIIVTKEVTKKIIGLSNISIILSDRKLKKTEELAISFLEKSPTIITSEDFFELIVKYKEELIKKLGEVKKEDILVLKILKKYSIKKEKSLIGVELITGKLKKNEVLFDKSGIKVGKVISIEKDNLTVEQVSSGNFGLMIKGQVISDFLFGSFVKKKIKSENNYTDIERYWINHCGKDI